MVIRGHVLLAYGFIIINTESSNVTGSMEEVFLKTSINQRIIGSNLSKVFLMPIEIIRILSFTKPPFLQKIVE